jgi:hypothetical protein
VLAGIRLLGRDMAAIASGQTGKTVASILEEEIGVPNRYRLLQDMAREARIFDKAGEVLEKLMKLAQGFKEEGQGKRSA